MLTNDEWSVDPISCRIDFEQKCEHAMSILMIEEKQEFKWRKHQCYILGCNKKFIMIDGNAKTQRYIYAARGKDVEFPPGTPNFLRCCINSPVIVGGLHKGKSKFCPEHSYLESEELTNEIEDGSYPGPSRKIPKLVLKKKFSSEVANDVPRLCIKFVEYQCFMEDDNFIKSTAEIPSDEEDDVCVNKQKYYETTAGVLCAVRPCGVISSMRFY